MENSIFNKIDKSQLTKIDTNKVELNVNKDLTDKIKDLTIEKEENGESGGHPCIGPAVENYIRLNHFDVRFDGESFIQRVRSITKPTYNVRKGKYVSHKVLVGFEVVHAVHYFGRPSRYDNFYTDEQIIDMINEFNDAKHAYMEVIERDDNGEEKYKTIYTAPRIYRVDFPTYDINDDTVKYYIAEIHFTSVSQEEIIPEPEDVEDVKR